MFENIDIYQRLLLALSAGLLIGFERGWQVRETEAGVRAAGIRTFTLIGLFGGLAGLLGDLLGNAVLAVAFGGLAALALAVYVMNRRESGDKGMTTEVAALIVFALGVIAVRGDMVVAAAGAVVTAVFLGLKEPLHAFLPQVQRTELSAILKLLLISVVLLPVLPDKGYGPGGIWNPYLLWWMVVLVSGLSLAGYVAIRLVGARRGTLIMGLLGGLASSTAVTVSGARMTRTTPGLARAFAAAIAAASGMMMLRTLVVALVLFGAIGPFAALIAPPLAAAALAGFAAAALFARTAPPSGPAAEAAFRDVRSPDNIATAIQFAIVMAVVIAVAHYARQWFGDAGILVTAGVSGLVNVDAVTISVTRLASGTDAALSISVAVAAILVSTGVNSGVKIGVAAALGSRRLALYTAATVAAQLAAGGIAVGFALLV